MSHNVALVSRTVLLMLGTTFMLVSCGREEPNHTTVVDDTSGDVSAEYSALSAECRTALDTHDAPALASLGPAGDILRLFEEWETFIDDVDNVDDYRLGVWFEKLEIAYSSLSSRWNSYWPRSNSITARMSRHSYDISNYLKRHTRQR